MNTDSNLAKSNVSDAEAVTPAGLDMVERARALRPNLRMRAVEAEKARRVSEVTIDELKAGGFFKMLLPKRVGGYELTLREFALAVAEVGKGCGSTAWVVSVTNAHHWILGLYPESVQDAVFSVPDTLVAAVPTPRGKAERVEGGYRISGFWPFCSGSPHASWVALGAKIVDPDGMNAGIFLVPMDAVELQDDWKVSGLRASGSNSVVARSVFVPDEYVLDAEAALNGERPNLTADSASLYRAPFAALLALTLTSPSVGMAAGAVEAFVEALPGRKLPYTDTPQMEHSVTQMRIGEASMKVDTAFLLLQEHVAVLQSAIDEGRELDLAARARIRMLAAHTVRTSLEAAEGVFLVAGGSSVADGNPIQRASRDLHAASSHGHLSFDINAEMFGRHKLGLTVDVPLV